MLSAILPTKGRGEQAVRCINRFIETVGNLNHEIIIMAYPDESNKLHLQNLPLSCKVFWPECRSVEAYNLGAQQSEGNFLMALDDDAWPADNWLHEVYQCIKDNGNNPLSFIKVQSDNTNYWAERAVISRKFCIEVLGGVLEIPHYFSQYSDVEKSDRAIKAGSFFVSNGYIEHRHWVTGKAQVDATYQDGGIKYHQIDAVTYNMRKAAGFPNDYQEYIK